MYSKRYILAFLGIMSVILTSCSGKIQSPQPYIQEKIQNQVFDIPIYCQNETISKTLEAIQQVPSSGSIIELITQTDCNYAYGSRDIPIEIAQVLATKSYKMLILGESDPSGLPPYTSNDWKWIKNLDTPLIINSAYFEIFPGSSQNADWSVSDVISELESSENIKYTNPYKYMMHFSGSLTENDIQQCDSLYLAPINYSGSQVLFQKLPQNSILGEYMKGSKDRAHCYAEIIR